MKNIPKKTRLNYTLLELISAMAVFLIICLVVLRFFNGAQQLVTTSNSYNEMHSDAQAFFDLLGDDLRNIVYDNEISPRGIYPFALSFYPIENKPPFSQSHYQDNINNLYDESFIPKKYQKDISIQERNYVPLLCFMSTTSARPSVSGVLPLCEVRYSFLPLGTTPAKKADTKYHTKGSSALKSEYLSGGKIIRSVTVADDTKVYSLSDDRHPHDSDFFPLVDKEGKPVPSTKNRIYQVFSDNSSSIFEEVVSKVYRMNISCYKFDRFSGSSQYRRLKMFDINQTSINETVSVSGDVRLEQATDSENTYLTWPPENSSGSRIYKFPDPTVSPKEVIGLLQLGHPLPDMIKVDIYLLSPKDWNLFISYYDFEKKDFTDKKAAVRILENKLRKFSRTFYINIKSNLDSKETI